MLNCISRRPEWGSCQRENDKRVNSGPAPQWRSPESLSRVRREVTVRVTGGEKPRGEYGSAGPGREGQADPLSVSDLEKAVLAWGARCAAALGRGLTCNSGDGKKTAGKRCTPVPTPSAAALNQIRHSPYHWAVFLTWAVCGPWRRWLLT